MFDKKTQADALERMVEFHTRAGNVEAATKTKAELDEILAKIEAEKSIELSDAVEIPIEPPIGKKIRKGKSQ